MAIKIYKFALNSYGFSITIPSGLESLTGVTAMSINIKKPADTVVNKVLTGANIVSGTTNITVPISSGELNEEGIYDYEVADTTGSIVKKGKTLQFTITKSLT